MTILPRNESGFTLVELMVAMLIMLVGLVGLLQTVNIAIEYNLKNQMRNEVTRVAQDQMNGMRALAFDAVTAVATTQVNTNLRNINRQYAVTRTKSHINGTTDSYQVDVRWKYKNVSTTYSIVSTRSRTE
ncbi:type IV pilus modification PilV family protein [Geomonas propionica]|uniref:Prepilin-type N-terminal cleavage/methylation domain-containing protein n=1 Tax=Geomonas propionica TaxID=2798582 RepID=A0ABS0YVA9_9BACT|nr:prepilin-type N-terminal cleavage/methylation domain-containing protein [Geomonas propionica]MBJ6801873.1 prepilin-type N-terminal cleavage/methylation domain-containing protein [Geomonas propionica]